MHRRPVTLRGSTITGAAMLGIAAATAFAGCSSSSPASKSNPGDGGGSDSASSSGGGDSSAGHDSSAAHDSPSGDSGSACPGNAPFTPTSYTTVKATPGKCTRGRHLGVPAGVRPRRHADHVHGVAGGQRRDGRGRGQGLRQLHRPAEQRRRSVGRPEQHPRPELGRLHPADRPDQRARLRGRVRQPLGVRGRRVRRLRHAGGARCVRDDGGRGEL